MHLFVRNCTLTCFVLLVLVEAPLRAEPKPNVLLLCVDDLNTELRCFSEEYIHSPNIDELAASGRACHRHYVPAPTCGASRFTLLAGRYGSGSNNARFDRAKALAKSPESVPPSMPDWFRQQGYTTEGSARNLSSTKHAEAIRRPSRS